jgi:hypothetical protein
MYDKYNPGLRSYSSDGDVTKGSFPMNPAPAFEKLFKRQKIPTYNYSTLYYFHYIEPLNIFFCDFCNQILVK